MEKFVTTSQENMPSNGSSMIRRYRMLICTLALATAFPACAGRRMDAATAAEKTHETEQKRRKEEPYKQIERSVNDDLEVGVPEKGSDLDGVLDELPYRYYDHSAELDPKKASESRAVELAKLIYTKTNEKKDVAEERQYMLEQLYQTGILVGEGRGEIRAAYYDNNVPSKLLIKLYGSLEKKSKVLMEKVLNTVKLESAVARKTQTAASKKSPIEDIESTVPVIDKDGYTIYRHADTFRDYSGIQTWLQPYPYACDMVSGDVESESSSLMQPESAKALLKLVGFYVKAGEQRKDAYIALQNYIHLHGEKSEGLKKYDHSAENDEILAGWMEVQKLAEEFVKESVSVARQEANMAEEINRCSNKPIKPASAEEPTAEDMKPKPKPKASSGTPAPKTPEAPTPAPTPESKPTFSDEGGKFVIGNLDASVAKQLEKVGPALETLHDEALQVLLTALVPEDQKGAMEKLWADYKAVSADLRKGMPLRKEIENRIQYFMALHPEVIPQLAEQLEISLD